MYNMKTASKRKATRIEYLSRTPSGYSLQGLLLPNAATFDLGDKAHDPLAQLFGLTRNLKRPMKITRSRGAERANRYIRKNIGYLHRAAQAADTKGFGKVLLRVVWYSNAFLLLAVHRNSPTWYKTLRFAKLYKGICVLKRIFHWFPVKDRMPSRRSYIPEANGKIRPIDAPELGWRFASGLMAVFLHVWLDGIKRIPANQHGALPGRGAGTAWKYIIKRGLLNKKYIYEFDLRSFFSAVRQNDVPIVLQQWVGLPDLLTAWFQRVADKHVMLAKDLIADNQLKHRPNTEGFLSNLIASPAESWAGLMLHAVASRLSGKYDQERVAQQGPDPGRHKYVPIDPGDPGKLGLPQGWACSPLLCCATLFPILWEREDIIMYMDDGLVASDKPIDPKFLADAFQAISGVEISWKKSRFVKTEGVFLHDFTFLGLEYLHATDTFRAKTRKGATAGIPRAQLTEAKVDELLLAFGPSPGKRVLRDLEVSSPHVFATKYDLFDFFMAYMYNNGRIDRSEELRRFLRVRKGSFLEAYMSRERDARVDLYNASTGAIEAFHRSLREWGHDGLKGVPTRGWRWGASQRSRKGSVREALTKVPARDRSATMRFAHVWRGRPAEITMPSPVVSPASLRANWPSPIPQAKQITVREMLRRRFERRD
jgi:hypothetical protein